MKVMSISSAYWQSKILHTAQRLNIFTRLKDRSATASELAAEIPADPRGLDILLIAATSMGLLDRKKEKYRNTPFAKTFLVSGSPRYQGGIVSMFDSWYGAWGDLDQAVLTGKPVVDKPHDQGPEALRSYIYGMHYRAIAQGELLARKIDFSGTTAVDRHRRGARHFLHEVLRAESGAFRDGLRSAADVGSHPGNRRLVRDAGPGYAQTGQLPGRFLWKRVRCASSLLDVQSGIASSN
ncbi:MAG: hypothetical protein MPW15_22510 [Candidatus Manganitrophus sp.]|nr:hypothetical protein [Candidatus Manganitrophus sp.]